MKRDSTDNVVLGFQVMGVLASVGWYICVFYIAFHFISKYW